MQTLKFAAGALIALLAVPALAQQPAPDGTPMTVRGTIEKIEGQTMVVKARDGASVTIAIPATIAVAGTVKRSLSEIKSGDMVASTSVKKADGKLHALEVHFLPPTVTESQRAYDLEPESLMTNAAAAVVTSAPEGQILKVSLKGATFEVIVDPTTPVVSTVPGDMSLLKPGAFVMVPSLKKADGTITATRITAEKDGVKPPM